MSGSWMDMGVEGGEVVLVFEEGKVIRKIVEAVEALIEEATFKVSPEEGFVLQALDPAKIAMVQVFLPKPFFSEIQVEGESFFGVNFTELAKVMKRVKSDDRVEFHLTRDSLTVVLRDGFKRTHRLALLPPEEFQVRSLKVNFTAGIRMDSRKMPEIIKELKGISSEVEITIDGERTEFAARSERQESRITIEKTDPIVLDIWAQEPARAVYGLGYLEKMVKPADISAEVSLEIATDKPMMMKYSIGGFADARVVYYLANVAGM